MESNSTQIIKRSSEFLEIKKFGQRFSVNKWLLANYRENFGGQIRFGVTASRKVGSAVIRNKLKRWTREYFRSLDDEGINLGLDINFIFRPMESNFYRGLSYGEFKKGMDKCLNFLRRKS